MTMTFNERIARLGRAMLIAFVVVGGLSLGLGVTTYTLAKANDYVLTVSAPDSNATTDAACLMR